MESARDRSLREQLFRKNWNAAVQQNRPLLEQALGLRRQIAVLLGEQTWAHFAMEPKMADPDRVEAFYAEMVPPLRDQVGARGGGAHRADARGRRRRASPTWDWLYYDMAQQRDEHGVDPTRSPSTCRSTTSGRHLRDHR